ncbi:hypothetical protein [Phenylobacterium sp.]|uniref:hypothetical protein n=1 Tax=Phenylobacterium sp. TaxID=1871053 RepID=UPI0027346C93|nr:hypothetical protein [Phenylobacterium sp.]MDP3635283.1 hypothetical protein [Phenylobacterium sp.]
MADDAQAKSLIEKIAALPAGRIAEVEDFVDFLSQREAHLSVVRAMAAVSEPAFAAVWDNPEDAAYDDL